MKIFVCGDPHINLGTYDPVKDSQNSLRKAVTLAFNESLQCAIDNKCHGYMHTGDFTHGPLVNPNLTPHEFYRAVSLVREASSQIKILTPPIGNHDVPKQKTCHPMTAWNNVSSNHMLRELCVYSLDYKPGGQEDANAQFNELMDTLSTVRTQEDVNHILIVAHHLWDGTHIYNGKEPSAHENWFKKEWCEQLSKLDFNSVTVILGHDHVPSSRTCHGINVVTIGTPVPHTFGDTKKRYFMIWNSKNGKIKVIPVKTKLRQKVVRSLEDLRSLDPGGLDRLKVDFEIRNVDEKSEVEHMLSLVNGVEITDRTTIHISEKSFSSIKDQNGIRKSFEDYASKEPRDIVNTVSNYLERVGL